MWDNLPADQKKIYENAAKFEEEKRPDVTKKIVLREAPFPKPVSSLTSTENNATYLPEEKEKPTASSPDTAAADANVLAPDAKDDAKDAFEGSNKNGHPRTSQSTAENRQQQEQQQRQGATRTMSLNDSFTDLVQIIMRQAEQEFSNLQDTAQRNAATLASTALEKTMGIVSRTAANLYLDARQAVQPEAATPVATAAASSPPPAPPASSRPSTSLAKPHSFRSSIYYRCDFCDSVIENVRHSCTTCPDFDLCDQCFPIAEHNHPPHRFIARSVTQMNNYSGHEGIPHPGIICDGCDQKCGHCADYDLCDACETRAPLIHAPDHVFLKIRSPIRGGTRYPLLPTFATSSSPVVCPPRALSSTTSTTSNRVEKPEATDDEVTITEPGLLLSSAFAEDINLPDGSEVQPNQRLLKIWKLKNDGREAWPTGTMLTFCGGQHPPRDSMAQFEVPAAASGEYVCVIAEIMTPSAPGRCVSYFRLCAPNGVRFGHRLWADLKVVAKQDESTQEQEPELQEQEQEQEQEQRHVQSTSPPMTELEHHHADETEVRVMDGSMIYPKLESSSEEVRSARDNDPFRDPTRTPSVVSYAVSEASTENYSVDFAASETGESVQLLDDHESSSEDEFVVVPDMEHKNSPNEKSPEPSTSTTPEVRTPENETDSSTYRRQLMQIHEMGLTFCDELALQLLAAHDGNVDKAVPEILENLYPE
ncbi:hypothetical protein BCR43DRAFT_191129 [Syncephalastrum racemosum]|uniref:UBA domain-containing protein n=1 Tax=Syncephalastrum racemosum TaxID=13706 RepID=A0A1X2HQW3_SYNRA|nr:hypothetical protein BCR43DRAFT_191129 [Syncephalastrum racemosum]